MGEQALSMNILLLGANGQVGWELQRALAPLGHLLACDRRRADLAYPELLSRLIEAHRPDVIINAAAYTAVDRAEAEPRLAHLINAEAVGVLAQAAQRCGALLVHYSTDYVFDGNAIGRQPEDSPTGPLNVYGCTKLEGERLIRTSGCRHLILRTCWVYASRGHNFAKTMLRLASERKELRIVADQIGAPTSAELIADITALMLLRMDCDPALAQRACGTYHLAAGGQASWHEYACYIIRTATELGMRFRVDPSRILAVASSEFVTAATRPRNSLLETSRLQQTFGLALPHWMVHARRMLQEVVPIELAARMASEQLSVALKQAQSTDPAAVATKG